MNNYYPVKTSTSFNKISALFLNLSTKIGLSAMYSSLLYLLNYSKGNSPLFISRKPYNFII